MKAIILVLVMVLVCGCLSNTRQGLYKRISLVNGTGLIVPVDDDFILNGSCVLRCDVVDCIRHCVSSEVICVWDGECVNLIAYNYSFVMVEKNDSIF